MALSYRKFGRWSRVGLAQGDGMLPFVGLGLPLPSGAATFAATFQNNILQFHAIPVPVPVEIDQIGIHVQAFAVGGTVEVALWKPQADGSGGDRILLTTVDGSSNGEKIVTLSPTVPLTDGLVFAGVCVRGGTNLQIRSRAINVGYPCWPNTATQVFSANAGWLSWFQNIGANPVPDPMPAYSALSASSTLIPSLFMRVSKVY